MAEPLILRTYSTTAGTVLELAGTLDYDSVPAVRSLLPTLTLHRGQRLTIDLGGITFCDSSGLNVLVAASQHARDHGADTALAAVPPKLAPILRRTGFDRYFPVYDSAHEADPTRPRTRRER